MRHALAMLLLAAPVLCRSEMAVVVSGDSPVDALNEQQVASIFLDKTNSLPNGESAIPVELNDKDLRDSFYFRISGKSPAELNSYWATLIFAGKGKPPRQIDNLEVFKTDFGNKPGAIIYLPEDQVPDDMKVVFRFSAGAGAIE